MNRRSIQGRSWRSITAASGVLVAASLLAACGGSAAATPSPAGAATAGASAAAGGTVPSQPATAPAEATTATEPANPASPDDGGSGTDNGPIGGDIGDRTKGSVQATISGGYSASIDLPFGAPLAQLLAQGPGTAYLPYTDTAQGTLFLTISANNQLLVQYAGPDNVGLTNGATPCELHLDAMDAGQAKGSFTCRGMLLIKGETMGNADMTGTFEAHK